MKHLADEAQTQKRKRREYRQMRKEQFKRPEPGFSLYEGRTRGKRIKYTYSDDEDAFSDSTGHRRSARNTSASTPAETGPVTTSRGRQIRAPLRLNMLAGDSASESTQGDGSDLDKEASRGPAGRPRRSAAAVGRSKNGWGASRSRGHSAGTDADDESVAASADEEEDAHIRDDSDDDDEFDEDEAMVDDDLEYEPQSLVVKLSVTPPKLRTVLAPIEPAVATLPTPEAQDWKAGPCTPEVEMQDAPVQESISVVVASPAPAEPAPHADTRAATPPPSDGAPDSQPCAAAAAVTPLALRGSPEKPRG